MGEYQAYKKRSTEKKRKFKATRVEHLDLEDSLGKCPSETSLGAAEEITATHVVLYRPKMRAS
jgi:hypothetical protein